MTCKFTFYTLNNFFQSFRMHPADCTGLFCIPNHFFIVQVNMAQFIQIRIFTSHKKNRNKMFIRISVRKCCRDFYHMKDLVNEI